MPQTRRSDEWNNDFSPASVTYYSSYNTSEYVLLTTYPIVSASHGSMRGVDIPNFHARKRRGDLLPMTPFTTLKVNGTVSGSRDQNKTGTNWTRLRTPEYFVPHSNWMLTLEEITNLGYIPEHNSDFVQEAAAKIYSNSHDTLTFLAELTSVRKMFLDLGRRLLKDGPPPNLYNSANKWLQTRYGWRTLMYDLVDLNKALQSLNDVRDRYSDRAGGTHSFSNSMSQDTEYVIHGDTFNIEDTIKVGERGSVTADIEIQAFQFNPLITGWELLPFSFLVDWFISIGRALAAWSFLSMRPNYVASSGYKVTVTRQTSTDVRWVDDNYDLEWEQVGTCTLELSERQPCSIPKLPHINVRLDPYKILDILALLIQHKGR